MRTTRRFEEVNVRPTPRTLSGFLGIGGSPLRSGRRGGFTLLELLVALAILGAALAIAVPQLTGRSAVELKATAQSVAAALRRTRDQAMSENQSRVMGVDVEARRFQAGAQSAARQMPAHIEVSLYTARSELLSGSAGGIRFFPDGSSTGGQIALSAKGRRYVIDVDWLTGRVRIYEDDESRGDG